MLACTYVYALGYDDIVSLCVCVLFRDRVEVSRDFIVGRCVIVCSMLEDKRYDFLFFFFNFVKNLVVVVLDYERTFEKCVLSYRNSNV